MEASCTYRIDYVECGEHCYSMVNSKKKGEALRQVGIDQAAEWGAELVNMTLVEFDKDAWDTDRSAREQLDEKIARGELPPLDNK